MNPGKYLNQVMIKYICFFASVFLLNTSCKKLKEVNQSVIEKYFESNVINKNFIVTLAKDSTADFTSDYAGYKFVLLKTDFYHGLLKATKGSNVYEGSWASNEDYSKLTIILPASPPEFKFLTRDWRFIKKDVPTLKLSPWGNRDPILLYMTRE